MDSQNYPLRWITTEVAIGYAPRSPSDLDTVRGHGINAVINLCAECYDLASIEADAGFNVYALPVIDEGARSLEELLKGLAHMDTLLEAGAKTLVHCRYGIGRTGTFAAAFLLWRGYSMNEALAALKDTPARPQSRSQWELLETLSAHLELDSDRKASAAMKIKVKPRGFFDRLEAWVRWVDN